MSEMYDAIHVSDLHLGADACDTHGLNSLLTNLPPTRRLILGGDVLEATEYRLGKKHWQILSLLRKLSDRLELVWVRGNHDHDAEAVAHLIGARWEKEFAYHSGEKIFLTIHGDVYDDFIRDNPWLTWWADKIYINTQRLFPCWARFLKQTSKTYLRCAAKIREKALAHMHRAGADVIICGHTHSPELTADYANTGCWTDHQANYLVVKDGRFFLSRADHGEYNLDECIHPTVDVGVE